MRFTFPSLSRLSGACMQRGATQRPYVRRGADQSLDTQLWIRNISFITGKEQLIEYFSKFGKIKSLTMPTDRVTGLHRGIAFMDFEDINVAKELIKDEIHIIDERRIYVKASQHGPLSDLSFGESTMSSVNYYRPETKTHNYQPDAPPSGNAAAKNSSTQGDDLRKEAANEVSGDNEAIATPKTANVEESPEFAANEATMTTEAESEQARVDDLMVHSANESTASIELEVSGDNEVIDTPKPADVEESSVFAANESTACIGLEPKQSKVDDLMVHAANEPTVTTEADRVETKVEEIPVQVTQEPVMTESEASHEASEAPMEEASAAGASEFEEPIKTDPVKAESEVIPQSECGISNDEAQVVEASK